MLENETVLLSAVTEMPTSAHPSSLLFGASAKIARVSFERWVVQGEYF
jgi:hypothetical protein